eukprot:1188820-Prorocentrum_minimum.AAC.8
MSRRYYKLILTSDLSNKARKLPVPKLILALGITGNIPGITYPGNYLFHYRASLRLKVGLYPVLLVAGAAPAEDRGVATVQGRHGL